LELEEKILTKAGSVGIPTLEEFINTAILLDFFIIIELKQPHPFRRTEFIEKFVDIISRYNLTQKILVQSFFPDLLYMIRTREPAIYTMLLFAPKQLSTYCTDLETDNPELLTAGWKTLCFFSTGVDTILEMLVFPVADFVGTGGVVLEHKFVDSALVETCRNKNMKIGVWTVNDESDKNRVRNLGVDFIISDCPTIHC